MIQLWAVFGFTKLYPLGEAAGHDMHHPRVSVRLRASLLRRLSLESDALSGRLGRPDSIAVLLAGSLMIVCVVAGPYLGTMDDMSPYRALYITLYLSAQIFCLGVIAFLAQIFAARRSFVIVGFFGALAVTLTALIYGMGRYGLTEWPVLFPPTVHGTGFYFVAHDGLSGFWLRWQAMGPVGAILPWLAVLPMAGPFAAQLLHPRRHKMIALCALCLMGLLGWYDLYGVRGHGHFFITLPGWVALTLAWGRTGYGPLFGIRQPVPPYGSPFHSY